MTRREFIKLIAASTAVWPLAARAQKPALPVIGFLSPEWPDLFVDRLKGFHAGLGEVGYVGTERKHRASLGAGSN